MAGSGCEPPVQEIDFSLYPYPGTVAVFPGQEKAIKISLGIFVELVALIGNILVILIVVRFKQMRTTTNYYLVNLAVSDLLVACMPIWIHVVDSLNEFWVFGSFLCKFNPFMQITAMCASMFTLLVLAGDRFFAIMFPMRSRVTRRRVSYVLTAVWVCAMAIASPLLFFFVYWERSWSNMTEKNCGEIWPMKTLDEGTCDKGIGAKRAYWIVVCGLLNWTPMVFMIVAYTFIVIKLRNHRIAPKLGSSTKSTIQQRSKRKVIMMLFSVVVVFIVCVVPFQTTKLYFLVTYGTDPNYKLPDWYTTLSFAVVLLMYSNSAINPIIYGGLNENFRKGFKDLIKGGSHRSDFDMEFNTRSVMNRGSVVTRTGRRNSSLKRYQNAKPETNGNAATLYPKLGTIDTIVEAPEISMHLGAPENSIQIGPPANAMHAGPPQNPMQIGPQENSMQTGLPENAVHVGPSGNSLYVGPSGNSMHIGSTENSMHVGPQGNPLQVGQPGKSMHALPPENSIHVGPPGNSMHIGPQENSIYIGPHENTMHAEPPEYSKHIGLPGNSMYDQPPEYSLHV